MRIWVVALSVMVGLAGCCSCPCSPRSGEPCTPRHQEVVPRAPSMEGVLETRTYNLEDLPLHKGILIVRATPGVLAEVGAHLDAIRVLLGDRDADAMPESTSRDAYDTAAGEPVLRYFSVKDLPIDYARGRWVVEARPSTLDAIDEHLRGLRMWIVRPGPVVQPRQGWARAAPEPTPVVVQIHAVADIVAAWVPEIDAPDEGPVNLMAYLDLHLEEDVRESAEIRLQGAHALIVRAPVSVQDRIAEELTALRRAQDPR